MIGVFDSGVGGLTTLGELHSRMPSEDICFLADTKNAPYGTKSKEELKALVKNDISRLRSLGADRILIACCTASTLYDSLSEEERKICTPIIAPTAKRATAVTKSGRIGVLATERTVKSHLFSKEIHTMLPQAEVFEIAAGELVNLAERGECAGYISDTARKTVQSTVEPFKMYNIDTLILGCTHFPLFYEIISDTLRDAALVSCSCEGAKALPYKDAKEGGKLKFIFG